MAKTKLSAAAQALVAAKHVADLAKADLDHARAEVKRLEQELSDAQGAWRDAQVAVDAELPQCGMVLAKWRSGKEEGAGRLVILRKTPGGMLITRRVGDVHGAEMKFKWSQHRAQFVQAEKSSFHTSDTRKLCDVPGEFLPSPSKEKQK